MSKQKINRKQFLQILAVTGAAGAAVKLGLDTLVDNKIVSETRVLMGTIVNIKAVGPDPIAASAAITACFDRMAGYESVLSRFQPQSQLSQLNQNGALKAAHPALVLLVQQSLDLSKLSNGAFDITVKPLLDLYQTNDTLPSSEEVRDFLSLVDYRKLVVDKHFIAFDKPGMSITLDGIAKGYIVDEGITILREFGFANVMVEAGGDLMALGEKAPQTPWKIGLQAPRADKTTLMTTFDIKNQALATSGDYMQAFTLDYVNHHIIDPRTGYSSTEFASVSVTAPTVVMADGLATTLMVMGQEGLELVEKLSTCEAYVVTKDDLVLKTTGFQLC